LSTIGFVGSKFPSRGRGFERTLCSKAEAFGEVSLEDMQKVCAEHKINAPKQTAKVELFPLFQ
jgi:hypothetical protein